MASTPGPWKRHTAPNGTHIWKGGQHTADVGLHDDGHLVQMAPGLLATCEDLEELTTYTVTDLMLWSNVDNTKATALLNSLRRIISEAKGEHIT